MVFTYPTRHPASIGPNNIEPSGSETHSRGALRRGRGIQNSDRSTKNFGWRRDGIPDPADGYLSFSHIQLLHVPTSLAALPLVLIRVDMSMVEA